MKTLRTTGIVLTRTDYGEADRILTFLTPDHGKLRLMARGVRKIKSKLAGGIELFSTSDIMFLQGRRDIGTLVSAQLVRHYGQIVGDIDRLQLGYDLIKTLNKSTEDEPEAEYYQLLEQSFAALNEAAVPAELIRSWFVAQLLKLAGHSPNLITDTDGAKLEEGRKYTFDYENVAFASAPNGVFSAPQIKALRLLFSDNAPEKLAEVQGIIGQMERVSALIRTLQTSYLQV